MTTLQREAWGPTGDPERHLTLHALRATLAARPPPPRHVGRVALLVRRNPEGTRDTVMEAHLTVADGLPGDGWSRRPPRDVQAQITVMRLDVAEVIANGQALTMFGDNVLVDMDLSDANLPAGTRLRVGDALVEVTPEPHNGCSKFKARFGADALELVQAPETRDQNLRGIHWRVIEEGLVRVGSTITLVGPG